MGKHAGGRSRSPADKALDYKDYVDYAMMEITRSERDHADPNAFSIPTSHRLKPGVAPQMAAEMYGMAGMLGVAQYHAFWHWAKWAKLRIDCYEA
jgi:hypothetical protein